MKQTAPSMATRLVALVALIAWSAVTAVAQGRDAQANVLKPAVLVSFAEGNEERVYDLCDRIGAKPLNLIPELHTWEVRLPRKWTPKQGLAYFKQFPEVTAVQPDYVYPLNYVPNDPLFSSQYAPQVTRCPQAWDMARGGPTTIIAVIDSGVDLTHPDLVGKLVPGYDFGENDPDPTDNVGHGTLCAGAAAAGTDNGTGVAGGGFNCQVMPLKASDANGQLRTSAIVRSLLYARSHGADIVSMSFGGPNPDPLMHNAILYSGPALYIAAAGNGNTSQMHYPAAFPEVIAVGATDANDQRASFSNFDPSWVDVAAPGVGVLLPARGGLYQHVNGTSFACPLVAGIAGLVWNQLGASGTSGVAFTRDSLEQTCDPVGPWVAFGRVNAERALNYVPNGMTKTTFLPTDFVTYYGSHVSGGPAQLALSDDDRLRTAAAQYQSQNYVLAGYARVFVTVTGSLREIWVTLENRTTQTYNPTYVSLYRWADDKWIPFGVTISNQGDQIKLFRNTYSSGDFVSARGEVRVKLQVEGYGPFEVQPDWFQLHLIEQ